MSEKKKRQRSTAVNRRSERATDRLYDAVAAYLKAHGGMGLVAGGVSIMERPEDSAYTFHVCVKITGRKPTYAVADQKSGGA